MNSMLQQIDRDELRGLIDSVCQAKAEYWMKGENPPDEVIKALKFLDEDSEVVQHMKQWPQNLLITEMNVQQIQTKMTNILHLSKFCDSVEDNLHNGNILKLLLRLDDLLEAESKTIQR